ncbi:B-box zinc finger protein 18-like isoform X1 [Zingiber officinale]|uniref:B-box zinc finger protein 18-like isoform X1 n=2 Tax=Zingiber officinale TaxID=94328 RepID=UPI001C4B549E|nr:B-box zinc finger protein 18-like isoform X1 [Zingiber officinale]
MGVKKCELCDSPARIHCESDQANLCWDCDAKVHGANFLVARHSRCLLCRRCQSPTPWRAEGSRLGGTVSVCQLCAATASGSLEGNGEGGCPTKLCVEEEKRVEEVGGRDRDEEKEDGEGEEGEEEEEEEDEESENGEEEDDIDEGENQVVPWSMTPPPVASSSSSDYEEDETGRTAGNTGVHLKRMRENVGLTVSQSQDDLACSSSRLASDPAESAVAPDEINSLATPFRSLRDRKRPAHALASPAPPVADSTTATMRNFRVHNANHRQGVGVFHAPKSA